MDVISLQELLQLDIKGKVICFPTDTVYGVGCLIDDNEAINKIYNLKNRDKAKPLAVLTGTKEIQNYVSHVSTKAKELMDLYWPGALTLVFTKSDLIPDTVTSNLTTVGLRMPNSKIALEILNKFGLMATTSINKSGSEPLNTKEEIIEYFSKEIDYLVSDLEVTSNVSSTVVDVSQDAIKVLRQGDIKII